MTENPHTGNDVLAILDSIIPDTPETRLVERQEIFRVALTQVLRTLRKRVELTQEELGALLGVETAWVSRLESANNNHSFESVMAYLSALEADFEVTILLKGKRVATVAAGLGMTNPGTVPP